MPDLSTHARRQLLLFWCSFIAVVLAAHGWSAAELKAAEPPAVGGLLFQVATTEFRTMTANRGLRRLEAVGGIPPGGLQVGGEHFVQDADQVQYAERGDSGR